MNISYVALGLLLSAGPAAAACATPVLPPLTYDRLNWQDLEGFVAPKNLNSEIESVLDIASGHGAINNDFYSITVDANGAIAADLFDRVRSDFNDFVFDSSTYSVKPYDAANRVKWESDDPRGAVLSFTLAEIPGVIPLEKGSVVLSCIDDTTMILSTIETSADGLHPVSGNRAFGVYDHGNGELTIFTKAADRITNRGIFGALSENLREKVFEQGHAVWLRFLDNIALKLSASHPKGRTEFSERRPFP